MVTILPLGFESKNKTVALITLSAIALCIFERAFRRKNSHVSDLKNKRIIYANIDDTNTYIYMIPSYYSSKLSVTHLESV